MSAYRRQELRAWLRAVGFTAVVIATGALLVLVGLSTIRAAG